MIAASKRRSWVATTTNRRREPGRDGDKQKEYLHPHGNGQEESVHNDGRNQEECPCRNGDQEKYLGHEGEEQ